MDSSWLEPKTIDRDDVAAAERGMQFKVVQIFDFFH
jgi:hypothetical protein